MSGVEFFTINGNDVNYMVSAKEVIKEKAVVTFLYLGTFALRWYGLLFALAFLISQQVLYYIYRQEGKPEKDVDTLTIYMVLATILGARLGHVIFYQPELFVTDPLSILLPFEFSPFRFTGLQGLASHGGAFGILFALWLYSRKKKPGQNYIQVLYRIVIVVALTGALIRLGNFFTSEIVGLPSNNPLGVVFVNRVTEGIMNNKGGHNPAEYLKIEKDKMLPEGSNGRVHPIDLGIDVVLHTGTKYIGGHSDLMCGVAVSWSAWIDQIKTSAMHFGGSLDAHTCALVERSLKTIVLRVQQQNENAMTLAKYLEKEPRVAAVYYPGLKDHPATHSGEKTNDRRVWRHGFI